MSLSCCRWVGHRGGLNIAPLWVAFLRLATGSEPSFLREMFKFARILLLMLFPLAFTDLRFAAAEASGYFPPSESQGGWRKLEKPEEVRALAGMDPDKLAGLKQWLLESDQRDV